MEHYQHLKPEVKAALLAKMRFSREQHKDLNSVFSLVDYDYPPNSPGFVYLGSLHIEGPSRTQTNPDQDMFFLTLTNHVWEEPATEEGLAKLEEILFEEWALPEGYFDEDLAVENPEPAEGVDDPDFFYWTVRVGIHRSWVADGFDISLDEGDCNDRVWKILPACDGSEFTARVLEAPVRERILMEQGYTGEELAAELKKS